MGGAIQLMTGSWIDRYTEDRREAGTLIYVEIQYRRTRMLCCSICDITDYHICQAGSRGSVDILRVGVPLSTPIDGGEQISGPLTRMCL